MRGTDGLRHRSLGGNQTQSTLGRHQCREVGIDSAEYFAHLREVFELDVSDAQIGAGWKAILIDEYALSMALIR